MRLTAGMQERWKDDKFANSSVKLYIVERAPLFRVMTRTSVWSMGHKVMCRRADIHIIDNIAHHSQRNHH